MKKAVLFLALIMLSGCAKIDQMNSMIDQSTCAIYANGQAVQYSTEVIRRNQQQIEEANKAIEENRRHLESLSAS